MFTRSNWQLLQTTNNSPMNSKPQQIKMQSTKKVPLIKREDGGPPAGLAAASPTVADDAVSSGAAPSTLSGAQQPQVC